MSETGARDLRTVPSVGPLERVADLWRRRKWVALLAFAGPAAVAVGLVMALPNIYRSTATILVERQQVPESFVRTTVTGEVETRLQMISQEILSRSRLEALITRFNLYAGLRKSFSTEELIGRMRNDIVLVMKSDETANARSAKTVAFTVSYRGGDPATVAQVTNTLASFYIEENLKVRARQATGTADFLRAQLDETKKQLDVQERRVSEHNRRHMGELPQQMTSNLAALEQLGTQLRMNADRQTMALARRESLQRQLSDAEAAARYGPATADGPRSVDAPDTRLARLRQELRELRASYTERYPEIVRLKAELAALEREEAAKSPDTAGDTPAPAPRDPAVRRLKEAVTEVEAELKAFKTDDRRLQAAVTRYQTRVENTPQREQEFQELSRDYVSTKEHYHSLLKRYQEAQLSDDMEQRQKGEHFTVLDPALAASEPAAPKRPRLLLMGMALSLGLAVGAVVLGEQLNTSFHSMNELRAFTDVPVLVGIPQIVTAVDAALGRRRTHLAIAALILEVTVMLGAAYLVGRGNERLILALGS